MFKSLWVTVNNRRGKACTGWVRRKMQKIRVGEGYSHACKASYNPCYPGKSKRHSQKFCTCCAGISTRTSWKRTTRKAPNTKRRSGKIPIPVPFWHFHWSRDRKVRNVAALHNRSGLIGECSMFAILRTIAFLYLCSNLLRKSNDLVYCKHHLSKQKHAQEFKICILIVFMLIWRNAKDFVELFKPFTADLYLLLTLRITDKK